MAPEVKDRQPYNEKVDIFSFGVILRLLLTGTVVAPQETLEYEEEEDPTMAEVPSENSNSTIEPEHPPVFAYTNISATFHRTPMEILIGRYTPITPPPPLPY